MQIQKIEIWQIGYHMQTEERTVHLAEPLPIRRGYHAALGRFWKRSGHRSKQKDVVYSTNTEENRVDLLAVGGGYSLILPLAPRSDLEKAVLLCDAKHPITLTAPNGRKYRHVD